MGAIRIDQPRRPSQQRLLEALQYPDRGNTTMPSVVHEQARGVVRDVMVTNLDPDAFVAVELTLYLLRGEPERFLIPDVLVTLEAGQLDQATGNLRKAYRIWDEGPPDVVIELASPSTVVRDNVGKKEDYAAYGVREYVQFDPLGPDDPEGPLLVPKLLVWRLVPKLLVWRLVPKLLVWRLVAGGYVAVVAAAGGGSDRRAAAHRRRAGGERTAPGPGRAATGGSRTASGGGARRRGGCGVGGTASRDRPHARR